MTFIQKRLVKNYSTLVMGKRAILNEDDRLNPSQILVPDVEWELSNGTFTTLRLEVEMEVALREIEILG